MSCEKGGTKENHDIYVKGALQIN